MDNARTLKSTNTSHHCSFFNACITIIRHRYSSKNCSEFLGADCGCEADVMLILWRAVKSADTHGLLSPASLLQILLHMLSMQKPLFSLANSFPPFSYEWSLDSGMVFGTVLSLTTTLSLSCLYGPPYCINGSNFFFKHVSFSMPSAFADLSEEK